MTIETKIAKNGSKRYYVRDENGKLKAISYEDAMMYQRQNERVQKWLATIAREAQIAEIDDYAVTVEAQEVAVDAETKLAKLDEGWAKIQAESNAKRAAEEAERAERERVFNIKDKASSLEYDIKDLGHNLADPVFATTTDASLKALQDEYQTELDSKNAELAELKANNPDIFNVNNEEAKDNDNVAEGVANVEVKSDRLTELKAKKANLSKAIRNALKGHYINNNGEFIAADDAGYTTIGIKAMNSAYEKLYREGNGEYVEVADNAIRAFTFLELMFDSTCDAINAEIARNAVKFGTGKWYVSDETDWDGNLADCRYLILKRTKSYVTIYNPEQDGWGYLDNYDANDEVDGEFDCIFRKKIQYDERGEYVDWEDENGELVTLLAKDETEKPAPDNDEGNEEVKADELSDEIIGEYVISDEAQTIALRAELANVDRANGNYGLDINGERVSFNNHSIVYIDATKKLGMYFARYNGKKQFYTVATQCGRPIQGSTKAIAASKIADRYMAKETAKEQDKFFHNFFDAHKTETGKFFTVIAEIVYADGYDHTFERQFDYFNQAQEFVGDVKKVTGDNPTQIIIKRNQQGGQWFYHLDKNGTEHDNKPETLFFQIFSKDIQGRIDELNKAIADNQQALDQLRDNPNYIWIRQSLIEALDNLKAAITYYEFIAHENEPCTTEEEANQLKPADNKPTEIEQIEKRMSEITKERDELYDALEEAEADDEISQQWIDYLEEELEKLLAEYNELWARHEEFKAQGNVA